MNLLWLIILLIQCVSVYELEYTNLIIRLDHNYASLGPLLYQFTDELWKFELWPGFLSFSLKNKYIMICQLIKLVDSN